MMLSLPTSTFILRLESLFSKRWDFLLTTGFMSN